jgi:ribosomal protein S18 acetylase RimI-like enzyme
VWLVCALRAPPLSRLPAKTPSGGLASAVPDHSPTPRGPRESGRERLRQKRAQAGGTTGDGHSVPVAGEPPWNPAPKPPRFPGGPPAPPPYPSCPKPKSPLRGAQTPGGTGTSARTRNLPASQTETVAKAENLQAWNLPRTQAATLAHPGNTTGTSQIGKQGAPSAPYPEILRTPTEVVVLQVPASAQTQTDGRADAQRLFEPICTLYDQVFSQPPFRWTNDESQHHRKLLSSLMEEPSFGIATADADRQLVGFAYGYQLPPDTKWWQNFLEPVPDDLAQEWPGRTFALIDLAVDQAWRGQGLGRELTEALLGSRAEQRATLSVQPTAADTQAFYVHLGWRKVGRKKMAPGAVSPFFDVYVVELRPQP